MIEKIYKNKYMVTCDNCGTGKECDSWAEAIDFMNEEGWRKRLVDGEWKHYCMECQESEGMEALLHGVSGKRGNGRMNGYHCLNCGEKLKQLSMSLSTDKYECPKCGTEWYKVRHIIVEWVEGEKKESEVEYNA